MSTFAQKSNRFIPVGNAFLALLGLAALATGCVPQDVPMTVQTQSSPVPTYQGFTGALSAHTVSADNVQITWNSSTDPNVIYYNIYDASFPFSPTRLKTVSASRAGSSMTALLTRQATGQLYKYRVRAVSADGVEDKNTLDVAAIPYGGVSSINVLDGSSALINYADSSSASGLSISCTTKAPSDSGYASFAAPSSASGFDIPVVIGSSCSGLCATILSNTQAKITGLAPGNKYACRVALEIDGFTDDNVLMGPIGTQPFVPVGDGHHLGFTGTLPTNFVADSATGFAASVGIYDANNNLIKTPGASGDDSALNITVSDDLGNTIGTVKASGGSASFSGVKLTKAGNHTLIASATSAAGTPITGTSSSIAVSAGAATLSSTISLSNGSGPYQVSDGTDPTRTYTYKVTLVDKYNNPVTSNTVVDFSTSDPSKQPTALPSPSVLNNADGTISYQYQFYSRYAGPVSLNINAIKNIAGYTPTQMVFDPGNPVGVNISQPPVANASILNGNLGQVQVDVIDDLGNVVTNLSNPVNISLSFSSKPSGSIGWLTGVVSTLPAPAPTTTPYYNDTKAGKAIFVADITQTTSLGVDKAGTYTMIAAGEGISGTSSVTFNVSAGAASKLAFVAPSGYSLPTSGVSGACLGPIQVQTQDSSGNAKAPSSAVTANLSSNGAVTFYKTNCSNSANIITKTTISGTNSTSLYFKSTGEAIGSVTLQAIDQVNYLTPASLSVGIKPQQLGLVVPSTVVAGKCTAISIKTLGFDGTSPNAAPAPAPIVNVTGLGSGNLYASSDTTCTTPIDAANIALISGSSSLSLNYKDNAVLSSGSATRNLLVSDNAATGAMTAASASLTMAASQLAVSPSGALTFYAGKCYGPFTVTQYDAQATPAAVTATGTTPINVGGASSTGLFYQDSGCGTAYNNSSNPVKILTNSSNTSLVWFKNTKVEHLSSLKFQDPTAQMSDSGAIDVTILPASVKLALGGAVTNKTNECIPITVSLMDAQTTPQVTSPASNVTLNLTATLSSSSFGMGPMGAAGAFYSGSDSSCTGTPIKQLGFASGTAGSQTVRFQALYAGTYSLNAKDSSAAAPPATIPDLPTATLTYSASAIPGWIGTDGGVSPEFSTTDHEIPMTFQSGVSFIQARNHGFAAANAMRFDPSKRWLYVADKILHRVTRYDFNHPANPGQPTYAGWVGAIVQNNSRANDRITGSGGVGSKTPLFGASPLNFDTLCKNSDGGSLVGFDSFPAKAFIGSSGTQGGATPGWCIGGESASGVTTYSSANSEYSVSSGGLDTPYDVAADSNYIYVAQYDGSVVSRYVADTGEFAGWIGRFSSAANSGTTTINAPGVSGCDTANPGTVTPGWCIGGSAAKYSYRQFSTPDNYALAGDGGLWGASAITTGRSNNGTGQAYIFVATKNMINRYRASDGKFVGWIGYIGASPTEVGNPDPSDSENNIGNGCVGAAANQPTPGWCSGGTPSAAVGNNGNLSIANGNPYPSAIYADTARNRLYVITTCGGGACGDGVMYQYNLTTGQFLGLMLTNLSTYGVSHKIISDSNYIYVTHANKVLLVDPNQTGSNSVGNIPWMGRVQTKPSYDFLGGSVCNSNSIVHKFTGTWCVGGTSEIGAEETAFGNVAAIELDGNGNLFVGDTYFPTIKKFDISTSTIIYRGALGVPSQSPSKWSTSVTKVAQLGGFDDNSLYSPSAGYVDETNGLIYIAEYGSWDNGTGLGRIKKIDLATGKTLGWFGTSTTRPADGDSSAPTSDIENGCRGLLSPLGLYFPAAQSLGTAWCLNAASYSLGRWGWASTLSSYDGVLSSPYGITGDANYLYVTDSGYHRISRFDKATGQFKGWVGNVATSPSSCSGGSIPAAGSPTPGWCMGGISQSGATGNGSLNVPASITQYGGTLYIVDFGNQRIDSFDAATGQFKGWIGRIDTTAYPDAGCNFGKVPASTGPYDIAKWCSGGKSLSIPASPPQNLGGGFAFLKSSGITAFGTNLYVATQVPNATGASSSRIDKYDLSSGAYLSSIFPSAFALSNFNYDWNWSQNTNASPPAYDALNPPYTPYITNIQSTSSGISIYGLWTNGTHLYALLNQVSFYGSNVIVKIDVNNGQVLGWRGGVDPNHNLNKITPVSTCGNIDVLDPIGYAAPEWCKGGASMSILTLGGNFSTWAQNGSALTGDSNYIYAIDYGSNRVTRLPK